jgi:hypothetical protein
LTWTGAGDLFSDSNRYRLKARGAMLTQWFSARQGSFEIVRTR